MNKIKILLGFLKNYLGIAVPLVLCHQITFRCNLRCIFCPFPRKMEDRDELTIEEINLLVDQASDMGVEVFNVWGGEPLLREDLIEILEHAKSKRLTTYIITNGVLLEEKIDGIAPYLDYISVSIDGLENTHERLRGRPCFKKIIRGIEEATQHDLKIGINCVISNQNLDELVELVYLADGLGVGISFEPVHRYQEISNWDELRIADMEKYQKSLEEIMKMKANGYDILNSLSYLRMIRDLRPDFTCHIPRILIHSNPYGEILSCRGSLGNIRERSLKEIYNSQIKEMETTKKCKGCLFSGYVETSLLYSGKIEVVKNTLKSVI